MYVPFANHPTLVLHVSRTPPRSQRVPRASELQPIFCVHHRRRRVACPASIPETCSAGNAGGGPRSCSAEHVERLNTGGSGKVFGVQLLMTPVACSDKTRHTGICAFEMNWRDSASAWGLRDSSCFGQYFCRSAGPAGKCQFFSYSTKSWVR